MQPYVRVDEPVGTPTTEARSGRSAEIRHRNTAAASERYVLGAHNVAATPRALAPDAFAEGAKHEDWFRALNLIVALAALILLAPLFLFIAVAIKLDSHGPVFYRQTRVGLDQRSLGRCGLGRRASDNGRNPSSYPGADRRWKNKGPGRRAQNVGGQPFVIYKFRTMVLDAEDATGPVWASRGDHRVTRVGRWLRRFRIDEAPQFLNVLKGEMSVVGPRPERPSFVKKLRQEFAAYDLRQRVRPGITGLAQVHRPPDQTIDDVRVKLDYDLQYVSQRSVLFDVLIMTRTLPAMLRRH
jgi:lipopolysaccharide/colanic/teichoic acid biosynthesis glycosyltransferase